MRQAQTLRLGLNSGKIVQKRPLRLFEYKDFPVALRRLNSQGGRPFKIAQRVYAIYGRDKAGEDPLYGLKPTNHGESRIAHCVKYDLGDGFRLVTIHHEGWCILCFIRDHDDEERWLDRNKGLRIAIDRDRRPVVINVSVNTNEEYQRISAPADMEAGNLVDRLGEPWHTEAFGRIPFGIGRLVERLTTASTEDEMVGAVAGIGDDAYRILVYDLLSHLRSGDVKGAQNRLALARGDLAPAETIDPMDVLAIVDGEAIRQVRIGSEDYVA